MSTLTIELQTVDWLHLFAYFLTLSLMAVGGAITAAPDMHRYLVDGNRWLSETQFTSSIAIAQAAPGPNVLFIALLGWNVGLNAGGGTGPAAWGLGALGVAVCMVGILLPSSLLTWQASRWGQRNRDKRGVRAFKQGMAPLVIGLLLATGWLLGSANGNPGRDWKLWLLSLACTLLVWRTRIHLLWLLAAGAALGALGWV
ncbi:MULTISPECIES: chromate transporter [Comamonas]|uniref:chromate transporter n=1 Tax=Comamonas TaxID=283 RepID=UPI0001BB1637|nr:MULTISPECIES: chromate transporter [Comamonas]ACY33686.1 Chromate transporter [Comamonas thiooxydans]KKI15049.1 chromate transporter [Comamonas thiooxydans]MDH1253673.1 chromate transporter [Comamonas thiooxydans]MDH1475745.1 chromate transporter [Comamonas thiooxydans]MDO1474093.1 chromate transporter [Comamonas thiooxydans]